MLLDRLHPHRRAVLCAVAVVLAAGAWAAVALPRKIYPDLQFARIAVIVERGEAPVKEMMISVTRPLEQALATIPDLKRLRSKTMRGAVEISADFFERADMREALSQVRARSQGAVAGGRDEMVIEQQTPAIFPVLSFNVIPGDAARASPVERARLAEWVALELQPRLSRLPDVFRVTVQSGDRREWVYEADPRALAERGVALAAVTEAISDSNDVTAVGRALDQGLQYQVLVDAVLARPEQILDLAVAREDGAPPVLLRDVGRLYEATADPQMIVTGAGADAVVVSVFLRDGGRITDLSRDVRGVLAATDDLPQGGRIQMVYDQSTLVEESLRGVLEAIALGALLAIAVLLPFLRDLRLTLVAGASIPISVLATLALFPLLGESLNLMSLGGIAVAIGLIIDDAIVVVENVARRVGMLDPGDRSPQALFGAVRLALQEVLGAIVGSSLTTIVVFLPLGLLEGVVGRFFRSLGLALGVGIAASLAVSILVAPLLLLLPGLRPRARRGAREGGLRAGYARLLAPILEHRWAAAGVLAALMAALYLTLPAVKTGFLPDMDEGGFVLDYVLPVGTSLQATDAVCRRIEAVLDATPEVASYSRRTGAELGFFATEVSTGDFLVGLKPREQRDKAVLEVIDEVREQLQREVPHAEISFVQIMQDTLADLAGNPEPLEIKLFGSDYRELQSLADRVQEAMERTPGIVDVVSEVAFGSPERIWRVDSAAAARLHLDSASIASALETATLGTVATRLREGEQLVDVRVRYPEQFRADRTSDDLVLLGPLAPIASGGTGAPAMLPLRAVAHRVDERNESQLERENLAPVVRVTAAAADGDLGGAARRIEAALARLDVPRGVRIEIAGQVESQAEAADRMKLAFAISAGLTFLLLVAQFRSFRLPLVILLALPFGQLGGLHALALFGIPLNLSSGMGLILLVGLVVKNGIILIECEQQLERDGMAPRDALLAAAKQRLRPIVMTTLASIMGLLPLALGFGAGSELQRPLAIAVVGGLALSTILTLVAVPVGMALFARRTPETSHAA